VGADHHKVRFQFLGERHKCVHVAYIHINTGAKFPHGGASRRNQEFIDKH